ncbi:MAG: DUF3108 domain-containing protein [Mariprofundaceae bacterium]|nr:DUF3108 domain-containing protein [Mariprofundaceae bacterium]
MFKLFVSIFLLLLPIQVLASDCQPYVGEEMKYHVGWEFIDAGSATMKVLKTKTGYRIQSLAKSEGMFSVVKKVRDEIVSEGICRDGKMQSTLFSVKQLEHKYKAEKKTVFDWKNEKALYTQNGKTDAYDVPAGYLNVLDAFFLLRDMPMQKGHVLKVPIFDARKLYDIEVHVLGKEKIKLSNGQSVSCIVIEPKLKSEAIFSSIGTMKVWLSDDKHRVPVKMSAKIRFGRIIARLSQYKKAGVRVKW